MKIRMTVAEWIDCLNNDDDWPEGAELAEEVVIKGGDMLTENQSSDVTYLRKLPSMTQITVEGSICLHDRDDTILDLGKWIKGVREKRDYTNFVVRVPKASADAFERDMAAMPDYKIVGRS